MTGLEKKLTGSDSAFCFENKILDKVMTTSEIISRLEEEFIRRYPGTNHIERHEAFESFKRLGFPTLKHEAWRHTGLSFLNDNDFVIAPASEKIEDSREAFELHRDTSAKASVVLLNGLYSKGLSGSEGLPDGVEISSESYNAGLRGPNGKNAHAGDYAFAKLNEAFHEECLVIKVKKEVQCDGVFEVRMISDSRERAVWSNPRVLVIAESGSRLNLLISYETIGNRAALVNDVTEIIAERNSRVNVYKLQNDSLNTYIIGATFAHQLRDSAFTSTTITVGGAFVRNDLNTYLAEENAESRFSGFYYCDGSRLVDNHTLVDHAVPNCSSNELYRGILTDKSRGVFNGRILVRPLAQKTNAYQSDKNILLSNDAKINAKPELEIYADDVKCSHGAASGSLNEEYMFYLKARGISHENARALLLNAFAGEVLNSVEIPELKEYLADVVSKRLNNGMHE